MTTVAPAQKTPPARLVTPRPLWERHLLFQEPAMPEGLELHDDSAEEDH